jgi:hypothetical protein
MPRDFDYTGFMKNRTKWSALFLGGFVAGCAGSFTPGATDGGLTDGAASLDGTTGDGSSPVDGSIVNDGGAGRDGKAPPEPPGGGPETACSTNDECSLVTASCCGYCSSPKTTDFIALVASRSQAWLARRCMGDVACPGCVYMPALGDGSIVPACRAGQCQALDVRTDSLSACTSDSDCFVRAKTCCECGSRWADDNLVAVTDRSAYAELVCTTNTTCSPCSPTYPEDVRTVCQANHCRLIRQPR